MNYIPMIEPQENANEGAKATTGPAPRNDGSVDARLGGLLNSLSGQVTTAFSQLAELHDELCAKSRAVSEQESELKQRGEQIVRESVGLEQLRASLAASTSELALRREEVTRRGNDLDQRNENLMREMKRVAALAEELGARSRAASELESELAHRSENMASESVRLEELRASLAASSEDLASRDGEVKRLENELAERCENLAGEENRVTELADDIDRRVAMLVAREQAVAGFYAILGRMRDAVIEPSVAEIEEAAAVVEEIEPSAPEFSMESFSDTDTEARLSTRVEALPEIEAGPTVDLSDFSEEELATFGVRRRLRAYSDEFLAAEIRNERDSKSKKKRWF